MLMKRHLIMSIGLFVIALTMNTAAFAQDSLRLTMANGIAPTVPTAWMFTDFIAPRLEAYSDGRIKPAVTTGGGLCSEHACVEQALLGEIDVGSVSGGNIGSFGSTFDILNLPYIFKDDTGAEKVMNTWLVDELKKRAREEMDLHVISVVPSLGFRSLQNRVREIQTPADLKGLKIRVTKTEVELSLLNGWNAVATPFDWANLYEGLETGVVDGMYIPNAYVAARKFYEVTSYITKTGGILNTHIIFMSAARYDSLPDWAQEVVDRVGNELQGEAFAIDREWQADRLKELEGEVQYYEPTEEQMLEWYKSVPQVWLTVKGTYDPDLAKKALEDQGMSELLSGLESAGAL